MLDRKVVRELLDEELKEVETPKDVSMLKMIIMNG